MYRIIFLGLLSCALAACSQLSIHKLEVEQGNILPPSAVNRLHTGMSEGEVRRLLGNPLLVNILHNNRLLYIYTFHIGGDPGIERRLILTFHQGHLQQIQRMGV